MPFGENYSGGFGDTWYGGEYGGTSGPDIVQDASMQTSRELTTPTRVVGLPVTVLILFLTCSEGSASQTTERI